MCGRKLQSCECVCKDDVRVYPVLACGREHKQFSLEVFVVFFHLVYEDGAGKSEVGLS